MKYLYYLTPGFWAYEKGNPKSKIPKGIALFIYGLLISFLLFGLGDLLVFFIGAVAFAVGLSAPMGNAIGPALHDRPPSREGKKPFWQKGIFLSNQWAALVGVGVVRTILLLPLVYFVGHIIVAATILFSAGTIVAAIELAQMKLGGPLRSMDSSEPGWKEESERSDEMWRLQDILYGNIMGVFALAVGVFA